MNSNDPKPLHPMLQARICNQAARRVRERMRASLKGSFLKGDEIRVTYTIVFEENFDTTDVNLKVIERDY